MVFNNKILKCYVLVDLKIGQMKPEYAWQMNMHLNYYNVEINDELINEVEKVFTETEKSD